MSKYPFRFFLFRPRLGMVKNTFISVNYTYSECLMQDFESFASIGHFQYIKILTWLRDKGE